MWTSGHWWPEKAPRQGPGAGIWDGAGGKEDEGGPSTVSATHATHLARTTVDQGSANDGLGATSASLHVCGLQGLGPQKLLWEGH